MKSKRILYFLIICLLSPLFINCQNAANQRLIKHINSIKVINTHEHQRNPLDYNVDHYNFYLLLARSYLKADLVSAGSPKINIETINKYNLDELWDIYGDYLKLSCNTSYYKHFVRGFQVLYDYNDPYFTQTGIQSLSKKISENYKSYDSWFSTAFKKAGFEIMFVDQYWDPYNYNIDTAHFGLVFHINNVISGITEGPQQSRKKGLTQHKFYELANKEGVTIKSLDDYLVFADIFFQKFVKNNVVCVKNSQAYSRTLEYEDISYEQAKMIFRKAPSLSERDKKRLQDFMFHWMIKKSIEFDLPIQIHTGYLAGNGNTLDNGKPIKLNNFFLKYPKAKFALFHGGYPWTGEFVALGKMFPNVYLDLVWLPQISKQTAIRTFEEILDCVPYNKIMWGGDCSLIEESVGSLEYGKDVIIQVLSKKIQQGLMTEENAIEIANRVFRENAIELFKLDEKLQLEKKVF